MDVAKAYRGWKGSRTLSAKLIEFGLPQVVQLYEIDKARRRRGEPSIGLEVQALIARLTSGGVSPGTQPSSGRRRKGSAKLPARDPRIFHQAKVLWDRGWGTLLEKSSFQQYLLDIPDIPTFPAGYDERFPHLVLVDRRIQFVDACLILSVSFDGDNRTFVPHDETKSVTHLVYWMRCQDGKAHRNHKPSVCHTEFSSHGDEFGLEAHEGLALYAQFPDLLETCTGMELLGSVHSDDRDDYACLERWAIGGVELYWSRDDNPHSDFGSASRGDCVR